MKFFITSEAYKTVGEKLNTAQNKIKHNIASMLGDKNYGDGAIKWAYFSISATPEIYDNGFFTEVKRYSKKTKVVEMRLRIDYEELLKADEKKAIDLVCNSLLRSIDIAESEFKIKDFDFTTFRKDLTDLFNKEGWI